MNRYILAALVCAAFAVAEALTAGRGVREFMQSLKQPRWSLPLPAWYGVGLLFYLVCYSVLVSLWRTHISTPPEFWLLVSVMAANADWNWFFFRRRDLRKSFRASLVYSVFVLVLLVRLFSSALPARWTLLAYACYLPYSWFWTYQVWRLNENLPTVASA